MEFPLVMVILSWMMNKEILKGMRKKEMRKKRKQKKRKQKKRNQEKRKKIMKKLK